MDRVSLPVKWSLRTFLTKIVTSKRRKDKVGRNNHVEDEHNVTLPSSDRYTQG